MTPWFFSPDGFFDPQLSVAMQAFFRCSYGVLLVAFLGATLPSWRRFFMSERWAGYAKSSLDIDVIQNPVGNVLVAIVWFGCGLAITCGWHVVAASVINLALCRYFFIHMRWKGVLRGLGAPGFMSYWLAAALFILEFTLHFAPQCRSLALLVLQVDFAFIMLSAGLYKVSAGYARNEGMEYGMVNPQWGYWWKFYKNVPPSNALFVVLNHLAWSTEVVAAVLMVIPATRMLGALLIFSSFIFIATQIRLTFLCEIVMVCCLLFFHPNSLPDQLIQGAVPLASSTSASLAGAPWLATLTGALLWTYLILLPLAHAGLFYNFYGRKPFPRSVQWCLDKYTNFFGLIIWRVFSIDVVNFFVNIYRQGKDESTPVLLSNYGWEGGHRYDHVGECITVTSLFTTLKYYASNTALFNERLLRYARTLPCVPGDVLLFEYHSVRKAPTGFKFIPVARYEVDISSADIEEVILDGSVSVHAAHAASPVHEGSRPGSYVPLGG